MTSPVRGASAGGPFAARDSRRLFGDSNRRKKGTVRKDVICLCQDICTVELGACIDGGAHTLDEIQEGCGATIGPCGGSCTPNVLKFLRDRLAALEGVPTPVPLAPPSVPAPSVTPPEAPSDAQEAPPTDAPAADSDKRRR